MPRGSGSYKNTTYPNAFHAWVVKVVEKNRIRPPKELADVISWLNTETGNSIDCLARLGPFGGLQIFPLNENTEKVPNKIAKSLDIFSPRAEEASQNRIKFAHYLSFTWRVKLTYQPREKRFELVLPEEPRKLQYVPEQNEYAIVFASGEIFEIWHQRDWVKHVREVIENQQVILPEALEEIYNR